MKDYTYNGYRPYGAGELYFIDAYVDEDSETPTINLINEGASFEIIDDDNAVLRLKSGETVNFVKDN